MQDDGFIGEFHYVLIRNLTVQYFPLFLGERLHLMYSLLSSPLFESIVTLCDSLRSNNQEKRLLELEGRLLIVFAFVRPISLIETSVVSSTDIHSFIVFFQAGILQAREKRERQSHKKNTKKYRDLID